MPVDSVHSLYNDYLKKWKKCRDVIAGQEAIHDAGDEYLPKLASHKDGTPEAAKAYEKFKQIALFYNATARTVAGLKGLVFRKAPTVNAPESMEYLKEDITNTGKKITEFSDDFTSEVLSVGRVGLLVEYPAIDASGLTRKTAESLNIRPYWTKYTAESIINWKKEKVNNRHIHTRIVLKETELVPGEDEFEDLEEDRIRVLDLVDGLYYRQRLFKKEKVNNKEAWVQIGQDVFPKKDGKPMDFIPFYIATDVAGSDDVRNPPLLDLVNININHYQFMASYAHGNYYVGLPTPWATGINTAHGDSNEVPTGIGPNEIWYSSNSDAKYGLLEFTGQGLGSLKEYLDDRKQEMASLGARIISQEARKVETAEKAKIDRMGENSVLSSSASSVSQVLTAALKLTVEWGGGNSSDVGVWLNDDYFPESIDHQLLAQLIKALQGGLISYHTFWASLQKGEIADPETTADDEMDKIKEESSKLPHYAMSNDFDDDNDDNDNDDDKGGVVNNGGE